MKAPAVAFRKFIAFGLIFIYHILMIVRELRAPHAVQGEMRVLSFEIIRRAPFMHIPQRLRELKLNPLWCVSISTHTHTRVPICVPSPGLKGHDQVVRRIPDVSQPVWRVPTITWSATAASLYPLHREQIIHICRDTSVCT